ncbi:MAG: hypothetical protein GXP42_16325 [Chloroflexi bacterium]|nr:hypothetical protein [Chloroflexota bacterium]
MIETSSSPTESLSPRPIQIEGRNALAAWREAIPANFFDADPNFQRILRMYLGAEGYAAVEPDLRRFGEKVVSVIDPAATINDRPHNHPRLERWDGIGHRIEAIEFHPTYHAAGRAAYETGVLSLQKRPGNAMLQSAYFYLLTQCGEMGHACPIVCTMGLIRALQTVGDEALKRTYLPPLLESDYDRKHAASQFLTEVQGGSDVGANDALAAQAEDGTWRIRGEKWFCSVANADQMLVTARPEGAPPGTKGLGVFLVPRRLPDGSLNHFTIRRLKTKFGTRTMASAEIDFLDAVAYPIGDLSEGIHIVTELVLNTSRWANAVGSAGLLRRAYVEAWHFAQHRAAFGRPIAQYPLVAEALAEMKTDLAAMLASTMRLSHLIDRMDTGLADEQERGVHRLLVNMNKYWTSVQASLGIRRAQEILGGNGAIEDFSIIPRLYRDAVVFESWEGSHNVLCLQAARDMRKYALHRHFFAYLNDALAEVEAENLQAFRAELQEQCERAQALVDRLLAADPAWYQTHVRRVVDRLAALSQAVFLLLEAAWEQKQGLPSDKADILDFFLNRYLRSGYDPLDDPAYDRLTQLTRDM